MNHTKDILVRVLPQILQYRIPLYLPHEQQILKASELILNIPHKQDVSYVDLQKQVFTQPIQITVESKQLSSILK